MNARLRRAARAAAPWVLAVVLSACGGGGGTEPGPAKGSGVVQSAQPGELATFVQGKLRARQSQRQAGGGDAVAAPVTAAPAPVPGAAAPAHSSTLVQESGVDEADLLKTDGKQLYTLQSEAGSGGRLQSYRRGADGRLAALASLALPTEPALSVDASGMLLSDDAKSLAVLTQLWTPAIYPPICSDLCPAVLLPMWTTSRVGVQRVDVADPAAPAVGTRLSIDGSLVDSRRIGDKLYLVTRHTPVLAADVLPANTPDAEREAVIAAVRADDLLPRVRIGGGAAQRLVDETDCWVQTDNGSYAIEITTVTIVDLASPTLAFRSRCFVGGAEAVYLSTTNLYVATTAWSYLPVGGALVYPSTIETAIHKFALAGDTVDYRGSGRIAGHLGWDPERKSARLSEHEADLRVLAFTGSFGWVSPADAENPSAPPPSPATLTILRERTSDKTLQPVSTLPNARRPGALGKTGEQVYAVRFAGTRAYLVTFRRIDPLYVLDLSDPADPKVTGAVEAAGYSSDLYPIGDTLLFGVGRDANANGRIIGLKFSLFDVRDPAAPAELKSVSLGGAASTLTLDSTRHGIDIFVSGGVARIALPVQLSADYASTTSGLQRFDVDVAARTLAARPLLGSQTGVGYGADSWLQRSVQIESQVYYLHAGKLEGFDWAQ